MRESVIVCVDDEEIVLRSLKRELNETFGNEYAIETAEGGEDALELFEDAGHKGGRTLKTNSCQVSQNPQDNVNRTS